MPISKHLITKIQRRLVKAKRLLESRDVAQKAEDIPLHLELLNLEQLERHAEFLAKKHVVGPRRGHDRLLPRLAANEAVLYHTYEDLNQAIQAKQTISPAGEWLLDNFHLIEEQVRTAKRHLPPGYSRELPHLVAGPMTGFPRVYDMALEVIAHVDGHIDKKNITSFVAAYQNITSLKIGELWAIPIMLRLALIENLRRVAARVSIAKEDRRIAKQWADELLTTAEKDPKNLILVAADMARARVPISNSFVAEFARHLQGHIPRVDIPLSWLELQLADRGSTIQETTQQEGHQQAGNQVSVSASIGSLRFLEAMDWRQFVESMSQIDYELSADPAKSYEAMDFITRDNYRHVIERLSKKTKFAEIEIAKRVLETTQQSFATCSESPLARRSCHVGYHLIDEGLPQFETSLGLKGFFRRQSPKFSPSTKLGFYTGTITLFALLVTIFFADILNILALSAKNLLIILLIFVSSSQIAASIVNWFATVLAKPQLLPRLDFSGGIPEKYRTIIAIPCMLLNRRNIDKLLEDLEVRYLANRETNLHFALVSDFADAKTETTPVDTELLARAREGIFALNSKYQDQRSDIFYLFHRARKWNEQERIWMGFERKRGKLEALNKLLRNPIDSDFAILEGQVSRLKNVKYVITLDSDTALPRDAAQKLISTMAHPLNTPILDEQSGRIIKGYGILQPRVAINLPGSQRSLFARLFSGEPGIDPYTRAVSDVYQDLFREGSYIGKGIYDIDAFTKTLTGRLPDNLILSHDLLEGSYARSGLVSDVLLYEDFPSNYEEESKRRHRWVRGDWQIAFWLLSKVPGAQKTWNSNPLSWLSKWKIFDNLRRSVVPIATLCWFILAWFTTNIHMTLLFVLAASVLLPVLLTGLADAMRKSPEVALRFHLKTVLNSMRSQTLQACLSIAFLPHEAIINLTAIIRSNIQMFITKRGLLEWQSASTTLSKRNKTSLGYFLISMAPQVIFAGAFFFALKAQQTPTITDALPIAGLWIVSPFIAWWLSQPLKKREPHISSDQEAYLRGLARRTWRFFETFVGPQEHWLPPDNFQEFPAPVIAHRTSPTNIGLSLLANLTAYDFGYINVSTLIERTKGCFETLNKLERFRGHFYNWYDTLALEPLSPLYVSTVDSGNLSGMLLTLKVGLEELKDAPDIPKSAYAGLLDTLNELAGILRFHQTKIDPDLFTFLNDLHGALKMKNGAARISKQELSEQILDAVAQIKNFENLDSEILWWNAALGRQCRDLLQPQNISEDERNRALDRLAQECESLAEVEYDFLYDPARHLLTIGYNVGEHRRESGFYDLLASEARLASFVAIAKGQLPQEHWFALGRALTESQREPTLLSWSGSMFEYLMPLLIMPSYRGTLLDQTYRTSVDRQIEHGKEQGVPWGISESGYQATDLNFNYQYRAFGVPGLGFKRGLSEDLVIAPYATMLAVMIAPQKAYENLLRMKSLGFEGQYGFYEAIDYTTSRLTSGQTFSIIKSYMAHHQGMGFLSLANHLLKGKMQRRFLSDPSFQGSALLLQERVPKVAYFYPHSSEVSGPPRITAESEAVTRTVGTPNTSSPEVHLLSNGRYSVMVTNSGGGYSRWKDLAITRWREDPTRDPWGTFCYIRDVESGEVWSSAYQPALESGEHYQAIFPQAKAEFRRRDHGFEMHTEITVSPEDDIELRRFTITNLSAKKRILELTTYAEVILGPQAADDAHPTFSNLFIQTEIVKDRQAILCTRRSRSEKEKLPTMVHLMSVHGAVDGELSYETDRAQFVGRGGSVNRPHALSKHVRGDLSGTQGSVLDPVVAIRCRLVINAEKTTYVHVVTGIGDNRTEAMHLAEKYHDRHLADRVFDLAWTHRQVELRQLGLSEADANLYGRLAGSILYANRDRRAAASTLSKNRRGQSTLWGYGISGDLPIVLLRIGKLEKLPLVRQMLQAHRFWQMMGLSVDLVICNEDESGYRQEMHDQLVATVIANAGAEKMSKPGGVFICRLEQMPEEDRILLQTVARAIIIDSSGTLTQQVDRRLRSPQPVAPFVATNDEKIIPSLISAAKPSLVLANPHGGFSEDGREYVITTSPESCTPAPWVNIIANPHFGSVVSESGSAYTWCENAHEFRLTPWNNDPLSDLSGEAFYIRDEETGKFWSPTPLPARANATYETRHGFGYSNFKTDYSGLVSELTTFVAIDAPVKMSIIKLVNRSGRKRRISLTSYCEWVLGELRARSLLHVSSQIDPATGAIFAQNPYHAEFGGRIGFVDASEKIRTVTCDRKEFIGRNGHLADPLAMHKQHLSGRVGSDLDACAALQTIFDLEDDEEKEVVFVLGVARDVEDAYTLLKRFRSVSRSRQALTEAQDYWQKTLSSVQVKTPDESLNMLANGWLLYQILACRLWARSAYYQSGGAFGFRDQLQDTMALLHAEPRLLRSHLLRCAGRQFRDGDVQHWWHPPSGRGVRTHFSDDYLWLPLATSHYVLSIGDTGVLDERVAFIEGRHLKSDEEAYADLPTQSDERATLYEHCARALRRSMRLGQHGLPLMGCGDWNDGMNLVGAEGRGESVWLGFFLFDVLQKFSQIAKIRGDLEFEKTCLDFAETLRKNIEETSWDGKWYRRAYFDNGEPLGTASGKECQIDSIPQSWAVLSKAGDLQRSKLAMASVSERLVDRANSLIKLFDPPFDKTTLDPGYIKGYVPGVRENGGQYTHAAIWVAMAFAALGENDRAWELFNMINPVKHGDSLKKEQVYKVEPYVVAADVYAVSPHTGRGGWTWYTGSAAWMYRLIMETLLGIRLAVDQLHFKPCLPSNWQSYEIHYRFRTTTYHILFEIDANHKGPPQITCDGQMQSEDFIKLVDDGSEHQVQIKISPN